MLIILTASLGNSDHCMAHLINEVTISEEGYIVIEWQRTGNGVHEVPAVCKIVGENDFFPCKLHIYIILAYNTF